MAATLQQGEVQVLFGGSFGFVIVTGRNHTIERCVVMPVSDADLLETAAHLAIAAVKCRRDRAGGCIGVLPGIGELVEVQQRIKLVVPACKILILHSAWMDHGEEADIVDEAYGREGMIASSTSIGARTVILKTVRYAVIHSAVRVSYMHDSGIIQLTEAAITPELQKNQEGRIARESSGFATHLYDVDDSGLVLQSVC